MTFYRLILVTLLVECTSFYISDKNYHHCRCNQQDNQNNAQKSTDKDPKYFLANFHLYPLLFLAVPRRQFDEDQPLQLEKENFVENFQKLPRYFIDKPTISLRKILKVKEKHNRWLPDHNDGSFKNHHYKYRNLFEYKDQGGNDNEHQNIQHNNVQNIHEYDHQNLPDNKILNLHDFKHQNLLDNKSGNLDNVNYQNLHGCKLQNLHDNSIPNLHGDKRQNLPNDKVQNLQDDKHQNLDPVYFNKLTSDGYEVQRHYVLAKNIQHDDYDISTGVYAIKKVTDKTTDKQENEADGHAIRTPQIRIEMLTKLPRYRKN